MKEQIKKHIKKHTTKIIATLIIVFALIFMFNNGGNKMQDKEESKATIVVMETSKGNIEIELNSEKAPISVKNFLNYVNKKHYDGTIFHRVISTFMIQGGGFTPKGEQKSVDGPIKLESNNGLKNDEGTIAMARTMIADSATSQFFINVQDNPFLNYNPENEGYAVFGKVTSGMEVIHEIKAVSTGTKFGMQDWPTEDVVITKVYLKE